MYDYLGRAHAVRAIYAKQLQEKKVGRSETDIRQMDSNIKLIERDVKDYLELKMIVEEGDPESHTVKKAKKKMALLIVDMDKLSRPARKSYLYGTVWDKL